jgi:hypothetical protein
MQSVVQLISLVLLLFTAQSLCSPMFWDYNPFQSGGESGSGGISPTMVRPRSPANTNVNPAAITDTTCLDPSIDLNTHDTNVAILSICGGIAGSIQFCGGNPAVTVGSSGTSKFTLTAPAGATINVSKGRWEGCVRAARAVCPTGTFSSTCLGGVSEGEGFSFVLSAN